MISNRQLLFVVLIFAILVSLFSEEDQSDLLLLTIENDVRSADYFELVVMSRQLGLDSSGTKAVLQKRILDYYGVSPEEFNDQEPMLLIESADTLQYFTVEEVNEQIIRISGRVRLLIKDGNSESRILADELIFNNDLEILTSKGNVEFQLIHNGQVDRYFGDTLIFHIDNFEAIFLQGSSEIKKNIDNKELMFVYTGDTIHKSENQRIFIENGYITSSQAIEPNYRVQAKRIWVLNPGEWAVHSATIYVGRLPVFYFPFFIYLGDELVFHPVYGLDEQRGYYLNTSYYLIGQKKKSDTGFFSFMDITEGQSQYYTEQDGIFLRKIPGDPQITSDDYLKLTVDMYSRLGYVLGLDADFDNKDFSIASQAYLGFTRNIYRDGSGNLTNLILLDDEYTKTYSSSYFLDIEVPFRYYFDFLYRHKQSVPFSLSLTLSSDPYTRQDFFDRTENFDWDSFVGFTETESPNLQSIQRYDWFFRVQNWNIPLKPAHPIVQTLRFTRAESSIEWKKRMLPEDLWPEAVKSGVNLVSAASDRYFYYPESWTICDLRASSSGTFLNSAISSISREDQKSTISQDLFLQDPFESFLDEKEESDAVPSEESDDNTNLLKLDDVTFQFPLKTLDTYKLVYNLRYVYNPFLSIKRDFDHDQWLTPDDIQFLYERQRLIFRNSLNLTFAGSYAQFFTINTVNSLSLDYYNSRFGTEEEPANWDAQIINDKASSSFSSTQNFRSSLIPFPGSRYWSKSSLSYSFNVNLYRHAYDRESSEFYSDLWTWDSEYFRSHEGSLNLSFSYGEMDISWNNTMKLPPLTRTLNSVLDFTYFFSSSRLTLVFSEKEQNTDENLFQPVTASFQEKLDFGSMIHFLDTFNISQNLSYDFQQESFTNTESVLNIADHYQRVFFTSTLRYNIEKASWNLLDLHVRANPLTHLYTDRQRYPMTLRLLAREERTMEFNETLGWQRLEEEKFQLATANLSYNLDAAAWRYWYNRILINPSIQTDLRMNFNEFTRSTLNFNLNLDFEIYRFLVLKLGFQSSNLSIYRYFPAYTDIIGVKALNPFVDLMKSFNFFNIDDRLDSNFNMTRINLQLVHYLDDWIFNFNYSGGFKLEETEYKFVSTFKLSLQWTGIEQIKAKVDYDTADGDISF